MSKRRQDCPYLDLALLFPTPHQALPHTNSHFTSMDKSSPAPSSVLTPALRAWYPMFFHHSVELMSTNICSLGLVLKSLEACPLSQTKSNRNNPDRILSGIWNTLLAAEILRSSFNWGPTYLPVSWMLMVLNSEGPWEALFWTKEIWVSDTVWLSLQMGRGHGRVVVWETATVQISVFDRICTGASGGSAPHLPEKSACDL